MDDHGIINSFEDGTTIGELIDVLTRYRRDLRIGLCSIEGGGCHLSTMDADGDREDMLWYDL